MKERITPAEPRQWSDESREILGGVVPASEHPEGEGPPNILYTIAHHPTLLRPFLGFSSTLALRGVLARRDSELLALRAAWNCRSAFEWGHHVEYALGAGLTQQDVDRTASASIGAGWSDADALLLRAADELHGRQDLSDELFAELHERFSDAQIVEITFVVGSYTMLSMVANATGVPVEARLPELPDS